ncbi:MAG: phage late control D family protein [Planctomycetota bacterium]
MAERTTPKFELSVDGSPVTAEVIEKVIGITVRQDVTMADTVEVRISNEDLRFTEGPTFEEGKTLSVKLGYVETDLVLVGTGTIVRRECEFPERGPAVLTVVAYDKRFNLKRAVNSKSWTDVKDSDVVSEICSKVGLSADIDDSRIKHKYLFQMARTDLAFVAERALQVGFTCVLDRENSKLSFKAPKPGEQAKSTLEWGKNLLSFRPRFSTHDQVGEVEVRGWDMATKKEVKGKATPADAHSKMDLTVFGTDRTQKAYGKRAMLYPSPASSSDEAAQIAKSIMNQTLQTFAEGHGSTQGDNKIQPGLVIELKAVGVRASGKYFVTGTFHQYDPKGYTTYFDIVRPGEAPAPPPPPKKQPAPAPAQGPAQESGLGTRIDHGGTDEAAGEVGGGVEDAAETANASEVGMRIGDPDTSGGGGAAGDLETKIGGPDGPASSGTDGVDSSVSDPTPPS